MKARLTQKISQKMALTPQMRQSIYILQLPLLELKNYLEQQLEENPALDDIRQDNEIKESATADNDAEIAKLTEMAERDDGEDFEDSFDTGHSPQELRKKQDYLEGLLTRPPTLHEHLLGQLRMHSPPLAERDYKIGEHIIGEIDENGFFQGDLELIAEKLKTTSSGVQDMLSLIQTFEPSGVGARNLKECLLIQLDFRGRRNCLAWRVVESHLSDLAKNKVELIARRLKVAPETLRLALKEISDLEPKPGRAFYLSEATRIIPDVIVERMEGGYEITVNGRELPPLKINAQYKGLLRKKDTGDEVKKYLRERLSCAAWLIKAVSQRQETIRRVSEYIVKRQNEFFEYGYGHLKPLTMKEVAENVERSESTISRVVNSKYIQTPYGIFALSYFFSGSFKTDTDGDISADTVKARITELVAGEDGRSPLSDARIEQLLLSQGLRLARRTIAKYREELKILPSHLRKK